MKRNKFYSTMYTAIINTLNSFISIILGLIFSRLLLVNYGSDINGLISSITQFVSFFTILEGGFTTAAIVSIYKPLQDKSYEEVNDILYTAKVKYLKIGFMISVLVLLLGSIYLLFIDIDLPYIYCFILIVICLLQTFLSIAIESKYNILFFGANKEYIITILKLFARLIGWVLSIIFIVKKFNIIYVYATYLVTSVLNIVLIKHYEKKSYTFINYKGKYIPEKIKGTNDLMIQKIANTIFNSTDIFLISIILNFALASVYSVYNLIYKSIVQILKSFLSAPFNSLGQLLNHKDRNLEGIKNISNIYNTVSLVATTMILTITAVCTLPFVKLYTSGVTDINYIDSLLVYLFFSNAFFQLINQSYASVINASGLFKYQNKVCIIAAILNIVLSIILGIITGIYGILLGSLVSYMLIAFYNIYVCNKKILNISIQKDVILIFLNYIFALILICFGIRFVIFSNTYLGFIIYAMIIFIIICLIIGVYNIIINYKNCFASLKYIKEKR